jgi:MFS family permease
MADPSSSSDRQNRGRTLFALGFGYFIDRGEEQTMSVLSPILEEIWSLNKSQLGLITTLRTITQTVSSPFWGYAADRYSRKKIVIFGTGVWGLWTLVCGLLTNFGQLLVVRAVAGLGLGCLMPATFSLLADHFEPNRRGRALGLIGFTGLMGVVVSVAGLGLVATAELWRWGFIGLGLFSACSGLLVWLLVDEPPRGAAEPELAGLVTYADEVRFRVNWRDVVSVLRIPTIWAAILQGVTGTMPWVVMGFFLINWMNEELGFSVELRFDDLSHSAPLVFAAIVVGAAISNFVGGVIGDWAERVSPQYGRAAIGQFSVFSGVPLTYLLFTRAQDMSVGQLFALCFFTALMIGWAGRGAKEPMMQAVVLPELRSSAYAVTNVIEGGLSALAGVIAGRLADSIGFTNAMLWTIPFPWLICGLLFSLFYLTYPKDAARLRQQMAARRDELTAVHGAPHPPIYLPS